MDASDQLDDPAGAGAAKPRHHRVGIGIVLQGVDQVHGPTLSHALCRTLKAQA